MTALETFLVVGVVICLTAVAAQSILVLGTLRELGVVLSRMGPSKPLQSVYGIPEGTILAPFEVMDVNGNGHTLGVSPGSKTLMLFTSASCRACQALGPSIPMVAKAYRSSLKVVVVTRNVATADDFSTAHALERYSGVVVANPGIHDQLLVTSTPFAILLDEDARVEAQGLVNTLDQLESLLELSLFTLVRPTSGAVAVEVR